MSYFGKLIFHEHNEVVNAEMPFSICRCLRNLDTISEMTFICLSKMMITL